MARITHREILVLTLEVGEEEACVIKSALMLYSDQSIKDETTKRKHDLAECLISDLKRFV